MRISLNKLLVTAAFGFVVGCTPGTGTGDGGVEAECESDTDCPDTDQCHPGLGICVQDCSLDDADTCGAAAPVCNEADDEGIYPLEAFDADADQAYRLLCICIEDSDCGSDEICDPDTLECVAGESTDECTVETEATDCAEGEVCTDGTCVPDEVETCTDDPECFAEGGLCDFGVTDQCVLADELTATCSDADSAPAQAGPPHIVVYSYSIEDTVPGSCGTDETLTQRSFFFDVYSEVEITADDIYRANFEDGNDRFFNHATDTEVTSLGDNDYFVTVWICGQPNDPAFYIDNGTSVSNAFCFEVQ